MCAFILPASVDEGIRERQDVGIFLFVLSSSFCSFAFCSSSSRSSFALCSDCFAFFACLLFCLFVPFFVYL